jgi:hypothetical protein
MLRLGLEVRIRVMYNTQIALTLPLTLILTSRYFLY